MGECAPCSAKRGLGDVSADAMAGTLTGLQTDAKNHPLLTGLATGILIWFSTRMLDHVFFGGKKR